MKIVKKILIVIWSMLTLGLFIYSQQLNTERKFRFLQYQKEHEMLSFAREINIEYYRNFRLIRNDIKKLDSIFENSVYLKSFDEKKKKSKLASLDYSLLDGIWAKSDTVNASFYIKNDSMYFIEGSPCPYKLSNDTLITYYDGLTTYDKIIKLDKDSLTLLNEIGDYIKLERRK